MRLRVLAVALFLAIITACASGPRAVIPGVNVIGKMRVVVGEGWLQVPSSETPRARSTTRTYTRDGIEIDRLMMIPGVTDGQAIFRDDGGMTLPAFRKDMTVDEVGELTAASLVSIGPGVGATITTRNVRPRGFGGHSGIELELRAKSSDNQVHRGFAGAFVADDTFYVLIFAARDLEYYNKHVGTAEAVFDSVSISVPTIMYRGGV